MSKFKTLLNAPQLLTFEELPAELQNEINSVSDYEKIELFKTRSFELNGRLHMVVYIETVSDYYVFTYLEYRNGTSIKKQSISKTTISMFQLLRNEDEEDEGVRLCSQN
ncbi:hypothetical protein [Bacillus gaemokensis]|uniref:Uncharacterized protein n=1 Tax=Bacillus gaemokensis TaxID=574375 RepID=A0A073K7D2_9BACI|nr:hypothetical protein [Bacillus gaemokensis]KEK22455.1 hypothetical protein BAGA_18785 [Bacillus gaemokensis]KYG28849.1 hypothetical protein AZF08_14090 [Bacillus gaemokensis]